MFECLFVLILNTVTVDLPPYVTADTPPTSTTHYIYECSTDEQPIYEFILDTNWKTNTFKISAPDIKMDGNIAFSDFKNGSFVFLFTREKYQALIWLRHNTEAMEYIAYFYFEIYSDLDYKTSKEKVGYCKFYDEE